MAAIEDHKLFIFHYFLAYFRSLGSIIHWTSSTRQKRRAARNFFSVDENGAKQDTLHPVDMVVN